jgi:Rieske Fe-S protein
VQHSQDSLSSAGRRNLLKDSFHWLRLALTASILYPLLRFLDYEVPRKPQLIKVYKKMAAGDFFVERDFILFESSEGPWAVSRKCTHLGCRLNYSEKDNLLICPCHESRFSNNGKRISGPARTNLVRYQVKKESENQNQIYVVTI